MTTRVDYTDREWELLTSLPTLVAFAAMIAEEDDPVVSLREIWAAMIELAQAKQNAYRDNPLIQEVAAALATGGLFGRDLEAGQWRNATSGPQFTTQSLDVARDVNDILTEQATPEEAAQYRAWILGIVRAASEAASSGLLGLTGERFTAAEDQYLNDLAAALGVS